MVDRTTLKGKILTGLDGIVSFHVRYFDIPITLAECIAHIVSSEWIYTCITCKSYIRTSLISFATRLRAILPSLCFALYRLPPKLLHMIFPPPCNHNRCKLRRYVSPPPPWYHILKDLYQPIERQYRELTALHRTSSSFPLLNLPPEIRNQIYLYASHANTTHSIHVASQWRAEKHMQHTRGYLPTTTLVAECDASGHRANTRQTIRSEDATSYQLADNGIIAIHGTSPSISLLLVNRQVFEEAIEVFWDTTAFEVQPLTPNDACWRLDQSLKPTYQALATSKYAKKMKKVCVRIDVTRFSKSRQCKRFERVNAPVCIFEEIGLELCVQRLLSQAENLCDILRTSVPRLRVLEIEWKDEFGEKMEWADLRMRADILTPFTSLADVNVRMGNLAMPEMRRREFMKMVKNMSHGGAYLRNNAGEC
jgi:hypothetical protein